jgi:hypothetical protein
MWGCCVLSPAVVSRCPATSGGAEHVAGAGRDGGDDGGEPPVGDADLGGQRVDPGGARAEGGRGGLDRVGQVGAVDGQRRAPGAWTTAVADAITRHRVYGLTLNRALGYREPSLDFFNRWSIRRLTILDRTITHLTPVYRVANTLQALGAETAPTPPST